MNNTAKLESEKAVLGLAMLFDELALALGDLKPEMMYSAAHGVILAAAQDMRKINAPIDSITLTQWLRSSGKIGEIGGEGYINELVSHGIAREHFAYHVSQVRAAYFARQIQNEATRLVETQDETIIGRIQQLSLLRAAEVEDKYFSFAKDLPAWMETLEPESKSNASVDTGFPGFDVIIRGLKPGDLCAISARPGGGKTALMTKMAVNMADKGVPVFYFSTEMRDVQFVSRVMPAKARVVAWKFRRASFMDNERKSISDACAQMHGNYSLWVSDSPRPSLTDMRRAIVKVRPAVVFYDYLQRFQKPPGENVTRSTDEFMTAIKSLCIETGTVGVLGCQMNRAVDRMTTPKLADLRDSGAIESESDQVILLHTPPDQNEKDQNLVIKANVEKNRHGATGLVSLLLNKDYVEMMEEIDDNATTDGTGSKAPGRGDNQGTKGTRSGQARQSYFENSP